jgi:PKHD-type hydroxylase
VAFRRSELHITRARFVTQIRFDLTANSSIAARMDELKLLAHPPVRARATVTSGIDRACDLRLIERGPGSEWAFAHLEQYAALVNCDFGFALQHIEEPLHWLTYREGEHVDWHLDTGVGMAARRKLSITIQLSEPSNYTGGSLEFPDGTFHPFARYTGATICFPSYLFHRVTPVTEGVRESLVAWIAGSPFT